MKRVISLALAAMMATTSVAFAAQSVATVQAVGGKVLVNKGEGFVPVLGLLELSAGDRVLVGEESFAVLSYQDCAVSLDKPSVTVVRGEKACELGVHDAGVLVKPTGGSIAYAPPPFFIPPAAILTTVGVLGAACVVGCSKIFGRKSVSP